MYHAEAEIEAKNWEKRNRDHSFQEISQEIESQRCRLNQASKWADHAQRQKISLYGELELRSRLFQENHARDGREIEELRRICCEEIEQTRKARSEELSVQQRRNPTTVSQVMAQIQYLQNKVNSLSDAREFYDPESESSPGATHVPDRTSTILCSRTLPRCDSGLARSTNNFTGIMGIVFERPLAQEGQSSTIFNNSKNLASSSQDVRLDVSETASRDMKRESLNTPIQPSHFQNRSDTSGTYSQVGMMDYPRVPFTERNLGKCPDSMQLQSWKLNSRTEFCMRTAEHQVTMQWIKEVEVARSIDELVTSRSITGQHNFLDFDMLDGRQP